MFDELLVQQTLLHITKCVYETCLSLMYSIHTCHIIAAVNIMLLVGQIHFSFKRELYLFYVPYNIFNLFLVFVVVVVAFFHEWCGTRAPLLLSFLYIIVASQRPRPQQQLKANKIISGSKSATAKC